MALFEALYGTKCRTPLCWSDLDEALIIGPEMIQETVETIRRIWEHIRLPRVCKRVMRTREGGLYSFK